jgi:hypothetical protein
VLTKKDKAFVCPICNCEFRHNLKKWCIGLPAAIILAIVLWKFVGIPPRACAWMAAIAAIIITARIPTYLIITDGKEIDKEELASIIPPKPKESRWFLVLLFSLVAVILTILIWSMFSS